MGAIKIVLYTSNSLQLYPLLNEFLIQIPTDIYLFISATSTFVLWGITSIIAFNNPIEAFLNKMLSEAQQQRETEDQALERNSDFFSLMHETIEENSERTGQIYDILRNVRAEVKDIQSINERMETTRTDIVSLKKQVHELVEKTIYPLLCQECSKPQRADFKVCPYCGMEIDLPRVGEYIEKTEKKNKPTSNLTTK